MNLGADLITFPYLSIEKIVPGWMEVMTIAHFSMICYKILRKVRLLTRKSSFSLMSPSTSSPRWIYSKLLSFLI
jgi:hypothetical protein